MTYCINVSWCFVEPKHKQRPSELHWGKERRFSSFKKIAIHFPYISSRAEVWLKGGEIVHNLSNWLNNPEEKPIEKDIGLSPVCQNFAHIETKSNKIHKKHFLVLLISTLLWRDFSRNFLNWHLQKTVVWWCLPLLTMCYAHCHLTEIVLN